MLEDIENVESIIHSLWDYFLILEKKDPTLKSTGVKSTIKKLKDFLDSLNEKEQDKTKKERLELYQLEKRDFENIKFHIKELNLLHNTIETLKLGFQEELSHIKQVEKILEGVKKEPIENYSYNNVRYSINVSNDVYNMMKDNMDLQKKIYSKLSTILYHLTSKQSRMGEGDNYSFVSSLGIVVIRLNISMRAYVWLVGKEIKIYEVFSDHNEYDKTNRLVNQGKYSLPPAKKKFHFRPKVS